VRLVSGQFLSQCCDIACVLSRFESSIFGTKVNGKSVRTRRVGWVACIESVAANHPVAIGVLRGADLFSIATLWSRLPAPMLGLDISSSSVKLVELGQDKSGKLVLERCATVSFDRGWVVDGNIEKFDEVAAAVRQVVQRSGSKAKQVAMALPPSAVITKKIVLPDGLSEKELELQVEVEANQYIPFPLDEVSLDFCIAGPSASPGDVEVLIAASRREKVLDLSGLAEAVGLKPVVLDVESYASRLAASRLIANRPGNGVDAVVALFEVGAMTTSMQVLCNDEVLYDRDQAFGGAQLTQMLVRHYGFSQEEAESKKLSGDLPEDYVTAVLKPFTDSLVQELGRALQFFFTSTTHNKVDLILLAGGSAALPGLKDAVARQTGFPCAVANPFEGMAIGDSVRQEALPLEAPSYLTACGLAMRRFLQ
jgi:type IV pilus assembly protein PilM